jgi:tetratricopeptide (TPR) repeat protein
VVDYLTYAGTYDKTKSPERAQFAGNNKMLQAHFNASNVFLWSSAGILGTMNRTTGIKFKVNADGNVDSLVVTQPSGSNLLDERAKIVIAGTSGKWKPGRVNDKQVSEFITIWVHVYQGPPLPKGYTQLLTEGNASYAANDYKSALKFYNALLILDELNTQVATNKSLALVQLGEKDEACKLLNAYLKYETEDVKQALAGNCQ